MLIGLDASRALTARRTGTERYSLELIRHLLALDTGHRWRLYVRSVPEQALCLLRLSERAEVVRIRWPRLWTHGGLSFETWRRPPDVLFVPAHVLPLYAPRRSVVTVHDVGYRWFPRAHPWRQRLYLHWGTWWSVRRAHRIIADSEATRSDVIRFYKVPPERVSVVYPGRDEAIRRVEDPRQVDAVRRKHALTRPYVLFVGTLQPRKNLERLIHAFARAIPLLPDEWGSLELVLAGGTGWLADAILDAPGRYGIDGRVRFLGYVPDEDLPALLTGARAFAFPSLYEGFGFPILEAQACGVPVLASNVSSLPEVAGDAALLVDPSDVDAMAEGLCRLVVDETLRGALVARGYANVERFSWARAAREVLEILESAGEGP